MQIMRFVIARGRGSGGGTQLVDYTIDLASSYMQMALIWENLLTPDSTCKKLTRMAGLYRKSGEEVEWGCKCRWTEKRVT